MKRVKTNYILLAIFAVLLIMNQITVSGVAQALGQTDVFVTAYHRLMNNNDSDTSVSYGGGDLTNVNLDEITSTAQGIAAIMPIDNIVTPEDAISVMVPTGVPEYGVAMGVSFDDPVGSLETLANAQPTLLANLPPDVKERFINLASKPVGISCEYCCGLGPVGITPDGSSGCGCQHNPALLSVTMWLMHNTEYTDAEILREVYKWKTLFFPKNMVDLAIKISGGDESVLQDLPGMVGGC